MNVKIKFKKEIKTLTSKVFITYDCNKIPPEDIETSASMLLNLYAFVEKKSFKEISEKLFAAEPEALIEIEYHVQNGILIVSK